MTHWVGWRWLLVKDAMTKMGLQEIAIDHVLQDEVDNHCYI